MVGWSRSGAQASSALRRKVASAVRSATQGTSHFAIGPCGTPGSRSMTDRRTDGLPRSRSRRKKGSVCAGTLGQAPQTTVTT